SSVEYISKEQALDKFSNENKDDPVIADALDEIGENPLLSSLTIKAKDQKKYDQLVSYLENNFGEDLNNINYGKNKDVIERLGRIVVSVRKIGISLGSVFITIAILITFNAIRLSLYVRKREFDVMRLVGASNLYIKAPTIFEGMFYGFFASILAIIAIAGTAYSGLPLIRGLISRDDVIQFYLSNFLIIGGSILVVGLLVGIVSSMIAIRKYLKA
ncbi:MAG TPA: FtsX-like permease family protein, partial [Candidatus Moranbacteria bacterium]|nr:FtsX-like permease family protein [Candidatus Moranbacteria bacterium]